MLMARLAWVVIAVGLGGCSKAATGSESGACYGNGTCNSGLTCLSNVCVNAGSDAAVAVDLSVELDGAASDLTVAPKDFSMRDAARYNDAGEACPGAEILHPSSDPRKVGTSVPFVGRAQNAMCRPIT